MIDATPLCWQRCHLLLTYVQRLERRISVSGAFNFLGLALTTDELEQRRVLLQRAGAEGYFVRRVYLISTLFHSGTAPKLR